MAENEHVVWFSQWYSGREWCTGDKRVTAESLLCLGDASSSSHSKDLGFYRDEVDDCNKYHESVEKCMYSSKWLQTALLITGNL